MIAASLIGGILLAGLCISRIKASRGAKNNVQTLFYTEKQETDAQKTSSRTRD
jgi:hypothetical protein